MTIADVYDRYHIMPNLAQHMCRVAGVADFIAQKMTLQQRKVHRENIVKTCLLHDLGNIVKFDLEYFPEFLKPEGVAFWQQVKDDTIARYGQNAHQATLAMLRELGVSKSIMELTDAISFNRAKQTLESDDWDAKICAYADMRVAPMGVVSMADRLADGFKRYEKRGADRRFSFIMGSYLRKIEQQLCEAGGFGATDIDDATISTNWSSIEV